MSRLRIERKTDENSTRFFLGDRELSGVVSVTVRFRPECFVTADVEVLAGIDGTCEATPRFFSIDPFTGEHVHIKKIICHDDSVIDLT